MKGCGCDWLGLADAEMDYELEKLEKSESNG